MTIKSIPYVKKATTAKTQYRELRSSDLRYILNQCQFLVDIATACELDNTLKEIGLLLNLPSVLLPKQSTGKRNSPKSMCEGIIDNFNKTQYNLSDKSCQGIQEAFRVCHRKFEDFEIIEFVEVDVLPKLEIPVKKIETTLCDLFDVEVTFKITQKT